MCFLDFVNALELNAHENTRAHRDAMGRGATTTHTSQSGATPANAKPNGPDYLLCTICQKSVHVNVWPSHSARHTSFRKKLAVEEAVRASERDPHGRVAVSPDGEKGVDFGIVDAEKAARADWERTVVVNVTVVEALAVVALSAVRMASSAKGDGRGVKSVC